MNWTKKDWGIVIALTLLAAAFRLYKLGEVPPGFQFDEAFNAIDAKQVLDGSRPLFLPANAGREVLYTYIQAFVITIYGFVTGTPQPINVYTLRLTSSLGGITAVPLIYLFLRYALKKSSRRIAICVALAQAISMWHIHFSHFGIRVVWMPVMFTMAFGLYWMASDYTTRWGRIGLYILAGIATGLTVYNHPTGRFAPFVLIAYTGWLWLSASEGSSQETSAGRPTRREVRQNAIAGLFITGIVAFLLFIPLGLEFIERPDFFFSHAADSSFLNEEVSKGAPIRTLVGNFVKVLGMFSVSGDTDWTHNLPGRPVYDPLMSIAFMIGLFLWGKRIIDRNDSDRNLLVMLLIWLVVMLFPSILSNDAPDYSRTMPTHPVLMLAPGLGLAWIWSFSRNWSFQWIGPAAVAVIVLFSGVMTFRDYFIVFASQTELYYAYDVDKLDTLNKLSEMVDENSVYLSRLWADHATPTFLRGQYGIQSIETSNTLVLPPAGKGAVYAFPHEQQDQADDLLEVFPASVLSNVRDPQGEELLHYVTVSADEAAEWPADYTPTYTHRVGFDEGPTLLGMKPEPKDGSLLLFWETDQIMLRDLTSFVHLLDKRGNKVGQVDRSPGSGTYRTPVWQPGERIIDRYWPTISEPCDSDAETRVITGWYQLADEGRRRQRIDGSGDIALAGHIQLPMRSYPAAEVSPTVSYEAALGSNAQLVGYTLANDTIEPGVPLTIDLIWEAISDQPPGEIPIRLDILEAVGATTQELWNGMLPTADNWQVGHRLCRRIEVRLPSDTAAGNYELHLSTGTQPTLSLTTLAISESRREFEIPEGLVGVDARLSDALADDRIALRGYTLRSLNENGSTTQAKDIANDLSAILTPDEGGSNFELALAWQAESLIANSYSVFVHVLNGQNEIIAQSDAIPGGMQTTDWAEGEVVMDIHTFTELSATNIRIIVGLYDPLTGSRMVASDTDGKTLPDNAIQLINQE